MKARILPVVLAGIVISGAVEAAPADPPQLDASVAQLTLCTLRAARQIVKENPKIHQADAAEKTINYCVPEWRGVAAVLGPDIKTAPWEQVKAALFRDTVAVVQDQKRIKNTPHGEVEEAE